jgi:hypothetical protein
MEPEETFIAMQRLGKHIPAEMNRHATIERLVFKQRIDKHSIIGVLLETVFPVRPVRSGYKEELVEFRDVSLPGCELGSRGIELSRVFGGGKLAE